MSFIVTNRQLQQQLNRIETKVDLMTSQQDEINADVQTIEAGVANLSTAAAAIQAEIDALKQQNPRARPVRPGQGRRRLDRCRVRRQRARAAAVRELTA